MQTKEVLDELKLYSDEGIKRILKNHGAREPVLGVKIENLKKILKKTKTNTALGKELFETGIYDAMYLAGLMTNGAELTADELEVWAARAYGAISEYTVPWVTSENPEAMNLAMKWIDSPVEEIAVSGWATLSALAAIRSDEDLDLKIYSDLIDRIKKEIHNAPNRVRYVMNGFIISAGVYISSLTQKAIDTGKAIGKVTVLMNGTACKVPVADQYISKAIEKGGTGKKRTTVKC